MELLYSPASKQPPTTEPSETQSGNGKGGQSEEEAGTTQVVGRRKFRYI